MSVVPDSFSVVESQLELAGRFVDQCQLRDSSVIDLRDKLGVRSGEIANSISIYKQVCELVLMDSVPRQKFFFSVTQKSFSCQQKLT